MENWELTHYLLLGWAIVVILGIILGFNKKVCVFNSLNDVGVVFINTAVFLVLLYGKSTEQPWLEFSKSYWVWGTCTVFAISLVVTFLDNNKNIFWALISYITKYSLAIIMCLFVYLIFFTGKKDKNSDRNSDGWMWLVGGLGFISYIVLNLINGESRVTSDSIVFKLLVNNTKKRQEAEDYNKSLPKDNKKKSA